MPSRPTFGRYGDSSSSSLGRNTLVAPKLSSMKRGLADMKRRTTGMLDQITGGAVETDEEWERRQRREAAAAAASGSGSRRGGGAAAVTSRFVDPADASYRYKSDDRVEEEEFAFGNNEVKCRSCKMIYADRNGLQAHYRLFPEHANYRAAYQEPSREEFFASQIQHGRSASHGALISTADEDDEQPHSSLMSSQRPGHARNATLNVLSPRSVAELAGGREGGSSAEASLSDRPHSHDSQGSTLSLSNSPAVLAESTGALSIGVGSGSGGGHHDDDDDGHFQALGRDRETPYQHPPPPPPQPQPQARPPPPPRAMIAERKRAAPPPPPLVPVSARRTLAVPAAKSSPSSRATGLASTTPVPKRKEPPIAVLSNDPEFVRAALSQQLEEERQMQRAADESATAAKGFATGAGGGQRDSGFSGSGGAGAAGTGVGATLSRLLPSRSSGASKRIPPPAPPPPPTSKSGLVGRTPPPPPPTLPLSSPPSSRTAQQHPNARAASISSPQIFSAPGLPDSPPLQASAAAIPGSLVPPKRRRPTNGSRNSDGNSGGGGSRTSFSAAAVPGSGAILAPSPSSPHASLPPTGAAAAATPGSVVTSRRADAPPSAPVVVQQPATPKSVRAGPPLPPVELPLPSLPLMLPDTQLLPPNASPLLSGTPDESNVGTADDSSEEEYDPEWEAIQRQRRERRAAAASADSAAQKASQTDDMAYSAVGYSSQNNSEHIDSQQLGLTVPSAKGEHNELNISPRDVSPGLLATDEMQLWTSFQENGAVSDISHNTGLDSVDYDSDVMIPAPSFLATGPPSDAIHSTAAEHSHGIAPVPVLAPAPTAPSLPFVSTPLSTTTTAAQAFMPPTPNPQPAVSSRMESTSPTLSVPSYPKRRNGPSLPQGTDSANSSSYPSASSSPAAGSVMSLPSQPHSPRISRVPVPEVSRAFQTSNSAHVPAVPALVDPFAG